MEEYELIDLVNKIKTNKNEKQYLEIKSANNGCPEKLYDTISSFSNQDNGGVIVFGLSESKGFEALGVYNVQDLQKKVSNVCENMVPKVRLTTVDAIIDGARIFAAEVPGVEYELRPVYYGPKGIIGGSYVRVGDSDEQMTPSEIYAYEAYKTRKRDDIRQVEGAEWKLLNEDRLYAYLKAVKADRDNLAKLPDEEILELMGVTKNGKPTLSGIMVFSDYPQAYFPNFTINVVVVPGNKMGDIGTGGERFIANKKITGSIPDMVEVAINFIERNEKVKTIINERGKRVDKLEYPSLAIREAVLNTVIHRDYSKYSENIPVTIVMFNNRIEFKNPGGIFGRLSIDKLGKAIPETRNGTLADILELLHITENRFYGIPTMKAKMEENSLSAPEFEVTRGDFIATLYNERKIYDDGITIEEKILLYCKEPRSREEIINFTGMSRYYTMSVLVKKLIDECKIWLTIPEAPKSKNQKYYSIFRN